MPADAASRLRSDLPESGEDRGDVLRLLREIAGVEDAIAQAGRVSGSIYHGGREHFAFIGKAMGMFAHMNVLQRDMYPSATRFESAIVAMTAGILGATEECGICGVVTTGGTESILCAVLAYRDDAVRRGIDRPELIVPTSAHPAFEKAGHYFGVDLVRVPATPGHGPDPTEVASAINRRTCAIVASAGDYAYGCVDDIPTLGRIAEERGVGLHVDACLGGFILPWLEREGADIVAFDFRVSGVTSMSADTHKFGYGPKGGSVVLYRDTDRRHNQYFVSRGWPGGDYSTPGICGSRSQAVIAGTWAAMVTLGADGYQTIARDIQETAASIRAGVAATGELHELGRSPFIVAFGADAIDAYLVNDRLAELGWRLNALQNPPGLHFCVTLPNTQPGVAEAFVTDLSDAVSWARRNSGLIARTTAAYARGSEGASGEANRAFADLDSMYDSR